eukprot:TRINITY_DN23333_c0_g1_i1.p1 TRINITY_DN23333_c0_g1~~TRINITY_DN23333_c0_g1_i1.p1  ORF type:complete len:362 (+),score=85.17 TRINITY_DN23333_c0_g1_i1:100-1086(+)
MAPAPAHVPTTVVSELTLDAGAFGGVGAGAGTAAAPCCQATAVGDGVDVSSVAGAAGVLLDQSLLEGALREYIRSPTGELLNARRLDAVLERVLDSKRQDVVLDRLLAGKAKPRAAAAPPRASRSLELAPQTTGAGFARNSSANRAASFVQQAPALPPPRGRVPDEGVVANAVPCVAELAPLPVPRWSADATPSLSAFAAAEGRDVPSTPADHQASSRPEEGDVLLTALKSVDGAIDAVIEEVFADVKGGGRSAAGGQRPARSASRREAAALRNAAAMLDEVRRQNCAATFARMRGAAGSAPIVRPPMALQLATAEPLPRIISEDDFN